MDSNEPADDAMFSMETDADAAIEDDHPNMVDPIRFYLRRDGEIVGCGCSFPFPHDSIFVSQTTMTAQVETMREAREVTGADTVEMLDVTMDGMTPAVVDPRERND